MSKNVSTWKNSGYRSKKDYAATNDACPILVKYCGTKLYDLHCICNFLNLTFVCTGSLLVSYFLAVCLLIVVGGPGDVVVAGGGDRHLSEYLCLIHMYIYILTNFQ